MDKSPLAGWCVALPTWSDGQWSLWAKVWVGGQRVLVVHRPKPVRVAHCPQIHNLLLVIDIFEKLLEKLLAGTESGLQGVEGRGLLPITRISLRYRLHVIALPLSRG